MSLPTDEIKNEPDIFHNEHDIETLKFHWSYGVKKTIKNLFVIAAIFLVTDFIAIQRSDVEMNITVVFAILVVPLIFCGLALLAKTKPLLSIITASIFLVGIIVYQFMLVGAISLIGGWLIKAVIIVLIIIAYRSAKEAEDAKTQLKQFT